MEGAPGRSGAASYFLHWCPEKAPGSCQLRVLGNLGEWFVTRVSPVQPQIADRAGKVAGASRYTETSNPMPERGMRSRWPARGGNIRMEKDGGLQLLPFGVVLPSLSKAAVSRMFFCTALCFLVPEPRRTLAN